MDTARKVLFRDTRAGRRLTKRLLGLQTRVRALRKWTYWSIRGGPGAQQTRVFVVGGVGKAGRSILCGIFDRDIRTTLFRETSEITRTGRDRLRLKAWDEIQRSFAACPTPLIVVETKVESQNTPQILAHVPGSKAIWMYRHYKDATHANLQRWHGQFKQLGLVMQGQSGNWRSEDAPAGIRTLVRRFYSPTISRADASALWWYARNVLYFERNLDSHPDVRLCNYEDLCCNPTLVMRQVYAFTGFAYPGDHIIRAIDRKSVGAGAHVVLNPEIDRLCCDLMVRLNNCRLRPVSPDHATTATS